MKTIIDIFIYSHLIFNIESCSLFSQYSLDDNPFIASEETEEEMEEIIDTRGGVSYTPCLIIMIPTLWLFSH